MKTFNLFGVVGNGRTATLAKQDAQAVISKMVEEGSVPTVISHPLYPGVIGIVFRTSAVGWGYQILDLSAPAKERCESLVGSTHTRAEMVAACRGHLAQRVMEADNDDRSGMEFLETQSARWDHLRILSFNRAYAVMIAGGASKDEAHAKAQIDFANVARLKERFLDTLQPAA